MKTDRKTSLMLLSEGKYTKEKIPNNPDSSFPRSSALSHTFLFSWNKNYSFLFIYLFFVVVEAIKASEETKWRAKPNSPHFTLSPPITSWLLIGALYQFTPRFSRWEETGKSTSAVLAERLNRTRLSLWVWTCRSSLCRKRRSSGSR